MNVKFVLLSFVFGGMCITLSAQNKTLKTRDGFALGTRNDFINACVNGAGKSFIEVEGVQLATVDYCACVCDNLIPKVDSRELITAVQEGNMVAYLLNDSNRSIIMDCVAENMKTNPNFANIPEKKYSTNEYKKEDIIGSDEFTELDLKELPNSVFTVQISIEGQIRNFLFDTGASELIIDSDLERELLLNGSIGRENYLEKRPFILANGDKVTAQMIRVNNVRVGDYIVNNTVIAVIDGGDLLLGNGFLKKFKNWSLDSQNKVIKVYK